MRFEGGIAKIEFGMLRGRKVPPYTVVKGNGIYRGLVRIEKGGTGIEHRNNPSSFPPFLLFVDMDFNTSYTPPNMFPTSSGHYSSMDMDMIGPPPSETPREYHRLSPSP